MKKIIIPAILAATLLVAGMFAFMPVERASTTHATLGRASDFSLNCAMELDDTGAAGAFGTIACSAVRVDGGIVDFGALTVTSAVLTEDTAGAITLGAAAEIGVTDRFTIAPSTDAAGGTVADDDLVVVVRATDGVRTAEAVVDGIV